MTDYTDKYTFYAEWFNEVADLVKPFLLSFYPTDGSLELYDVKCKRIFLRRTKFEGITLSSLYLGSMLNIFSRQIKIIDYANLWTKNHFLSQLQTIFFIMKPNAVPKIGATLSYLEKENYQICRLKMGKMSDAAIEASEDTSIESHGDECKEEKRCIPSVAVQVIGENALDRFLTAAGMKSPLASPSPLEAVLQTESLNNHLIFSASSDLQAKQMDIWFPSEGKSSVKSSCRLNGSTCCIIKPHAVEDRSVGEILSFITENGFTVEGMEMMSIEKSTAEKFYEVYRGVVPEYAGMVTQLSSGPCIVLELAHVNDPASSASIFRKLAGPNDPVIAKQQSPDSIRAKYGKSIVMNAVHSTDLPEDAPLEVEFFFKLLQPT